MEFQFNAVREANRAYKDLFDAGWGQFNHEVRMARPEPHLERLKEKHRELDALKSAQRKANIEALAVGQMNCLLFVTSTQEHWQRLVSRFEMAFRSKSLWDKFEMLESMKEDRSKFLRAAGQEIGLPYRELIPEDPEGRECRRAETLKSLEEIEPRDGPKPPNQTGRN
ncbi:MAG TPA: hypothetical protein VGR67_01810 [Candidatus Polarisedimenticolia bacterium]|jgi:hypothetical protein|nr:hypothetical protein [Candidatus Polarisedimenticolia bacterium]